jgi:hypothetical protein
MSIRFEAVDDDFLDEHGNADLFFGRFHSLLVLMLWILHRRAEETAGLVGAAVEPSIRTTNC